MKTKEATPPTSGLVLPLAVPLAPTPATAPIVGGDTVALMTVPSVSGVPLRRVTVTVSVAVEFVPTEVDDTSIFTLSADGGPNAEAWAYPPPAMKNSEPSSRVRNRIGAFMMTSPVLL